MKTFLISILIGVTVNMSVESQQKENRFRNGWYFESTEQDTLNPVHSKFEEIILYIESDPIVTVDEFARIDIVRTNWGGKDFKVLDVVLKEDAKEKWANATERMSKTNELAHFVYRDQVISTVTASRRMENGYASISNENFTEEFLEKVVQDIKNDCGQQRLRKHAD